MQYGTQDPPAQGSALVNTGSLASNGKAEADHLAIISRTQTVLEREAKAFLEKYGHILRMGTPLPAQATIEVRGLIAGMEILAQDLCAVLP